MNALKTLACALAVAGLMAGCASDVKLDEAPVESRVPVNPNAGMNSGGASTGTSQSSVASVDLSANALNASSANRTVYFDFDSYVVKDQYRPIVELNARQLTTDRARRMTIEGHTDSRGGREYNLALGQKRAEAVSRSLTLLGAAANQLEAVSYGMERPAATGTDDESAAKNRRAEMTYR
ncbi:peptidoglycan-associated lipoprotein Pal [soil metagenome]